MDQGAAESQLLFHAAGELAGRAREEGRKPSASGQRVDAPPALGGGMAKESAEELKVLLHRQGRVEVLAQALRHIRDLRADPRPMSAAAHVAAQGMHAALLNGAGAGEQRQQAGLAHTVRSEQSDDAPGWDVQGDAVERRSLAVAQDDVSQTGDGSRGVRPLEPSMRQFQVFLTARCFAIAGISIRCAASAISFSISSER